MDDPFIDTGGVGKGSKEVLPLPVIAHKQEILDAINENQVTIIVGPTGCGKSTQVPQFIYDDVRTRGMACRIVITQPRRIAAMTVAERVAKERCSMLGNLVGFMIGNAEVKSDYARILFTTPGILVKTLTRTKKAQNYTHYIIDEIHSRDVETDILLLILRYFLVLDYDTHTKIILMSATLEPEQFQDYFHDWKNDNGKLPFGQAKLVRITIPVHRASEFLNYEIKEIYLDELSEFLGIYNGAIPAPYQSPYEVSRIQPGGYQACMSILCHLDQSEKNGTSTIIDRPGGVLVFLPGINEIDSMLQKCQEETERNPALKWKVFPLHSLLAKEEQKLAFESVEKNYRKIVLATNIAESSVTVPDIKYVIDFCLMKSLITNCSLNTLQLLWASQTECTQRKGRVGRVCDGIVFRMVTKAFYNELPKESTPEMCRITLESAIINFKLLNMIDPLKWTGLAPNPPSITAFETSMANLKLFGGLTIDYCGVPSINNGHLTGLGKFMGALPLEPVLSKLLALGFAFGVLEETIIIVAGMNEKNPFTRSFLNPVAIIDKKKAVVGNSSYPSDPIAILTLFRKWRNRHLEFQTYTSSGFHNKTFVSPNAMRQMEFLVTDITQRLKGINITVDVNRLNKLKPDLDELTLLRIVLAGAFYPNYFYRFKTPSSSVGKSDAKGKITLHSWVQAYKSKSILMDRNSINYMTAAEINRVSRVQPNLLACCILSGSKNEQAITLRETVVIPSIPGIFDLLGMLFCPKLEFRLTPDQSQITGYLAGLGLDKEGKNPLYPSRDMEVTFETQLSTVDIELINRVRSILSTIMSGLTSTFYTDPSFEDQVKKQHPKLLALINKLLLTTRKPKERIPAHEPYSWTKVIAGIHSPNIGKPITRDIYPQHIVPKLRNRKST